MPGHTGPHEDALEFIRWQRSKAKVWTRACILVLVGRNGRGRESREIG